MQFVRKILTEDKFEHIRSTLLWWYVLSYQPTTVLVSSNNYVVWPKIDQMHNASSYEIQTKNPKYLKWEEKSKRQG